jgi:hypothetical protein
VSSHTAIPASLNVKSTLEAILDRFFNSECPHLGEEEQIDLLHAALDRCWKEARSLQEEAHYRRAVEPEEMANTSGLLMHRSARYQAAACALGIRLL